MPHAISIHAPPRGATFTRAVFVVTSDIFQFTPLREGRLDQLYQGETGGISIHAPPRGATRPALRCSEKSLFQFTPLREGRLLHRVEIHLRRAFQFTPLREGRPRLWKKTSSATFHFNSRPSARGDEIPVILAMSAIFISIHAPPRGATVRSLAQAWSASSFQFTPLREGRQVRVVSPPHGIISIHAPPRGATPRRQSGIAVPRYFNSRPSARGDPRTLLLPLEALHISIHAPPRGATRFARQRGQALHISIHAPPRGATSR